MKYIVKLTLEIKNFLRMAAASRQPSFAKAQVRPSPRLLRCHDAQEEGQLRRPSGKGGV